MTQMKKVLIQSNIFLFSFILSQSTYEIEKAKQFISKNGLSESQVKQIAKNQGYSDKQINNIYDKEILDGNDGVNKNNNDRTFNENLKRSLDIDKKGLSNFEANQKNDINNIKIESKQETQSDLVDYFGYQIFKQDPSLFQASAVGAISPDYLIGPGDEIIVMLWGETQFRQILTVDREGFVFIPELGQVFVNGLNLTLLESKLFRVFSQSYSSLNARGTSPTTFLDVSLGNMRPLRVQVLGEVAQPGAYTISHSATLFSSLYYFNGPTTLGSLRDIQLIRSGEIIGSIDFYDYLLTGKKPKDYKLQLDDVIFIPKRMKSVTISGEINRKGIYELKENENFFDLIRIAGRLKVTAYLDRSQIDRIVPFIKRKNLGSDRIYIDVNLEDIILQKSNFELNDGDNIKVFSILDFRQNIVEIDGAVSRPGRYDLGDSLRVNDLINKSGGVLGDAYLNSMDIIRVNSDLTEELIKINLNKALDGDLDHNIKLQELDQIKVYSTINMIEKKYVTIAGNVKFPGKYLLQNNMTAYDLIFMAGGFVDEEFKNKTYLDRADLFRLSENKITRHIRSFNLKELLDDPKKLNNFILLPDDIIKIYKKNIFITNKPVSINGEVRNPGNYIFKTNMTIKDLILAANGLNDDIYRFKIEVARINPMNSDINKYAKTILFEINSNLDLYMSENKGGNTQKKLREDNNFILEPYDIVSIRPDPFFKKQKKVNIFGEVFFPGEYVILSPDEKLTDILKRAGGVLPNAYIEASYFIRNNKKINFSLEKFLKRTKSNLNFKVKNGDQITIMAYPKLVTIEGEINNPGVKKFSPNKRLRYYLKNAGGLTPAADKNNIWVEFPDGNSKEFNSVFTGNPKILDGSKIIIGKKEKEEPFDKTEFFKEFSSIVANVAQSITIVYLAIKK